MTRPRLNPPRRVHILWRYARDLRARATLRRAALAALADRSVPAYDVEIVVVAAAEMSRLHRRFLRVAGPTDVLTFDISEPTGPLELQIVVCADVARAVAGDLRRSAVAELALYVVHGILHATGFNDHSDATARRMHRRENLILTGLGLGPVYNAHARSASFFRAKLDFRDQAGLP